MRVLLTGAAGQLGVELRRTCPQGVELRALDRAALDISDRDRVLQAVTDWQPALLINAAAYNAVDDAESKPDQALAINAEAPGYLATAAARQQAQFIHLSTDYVFDGSADTPYPPHHQTRPLGVYGHSKLAGECRVRELMPHCTVIRTAWVYASHGNNFVRTMLKLMAQRDRLRVVADQRSAPTWARGLAQALWQFSALASHGIYHWTDAGACSRYQFACAIQREALELGLLSRAIPIEPIAASEYPSPAARPTCSVLDCSASERLLGQRRRDWRAQLRDMLLELAEQ